MSKEKCWVFDGENYSHGETLRQAKADLIFKLSNRDTSQYENLTTESVITYADAVQQSTPNTPKKTIKIIKINK